MINAIEAHKITEKNDTRKTGLRNVIENVMPVCDEHIRRVAGFGGSRAVISRDEVMANVSFTFYTRKEIMDAVVTELKGFGFKAEATPSYSSIHIEW